MDEGIRLIDENGGSELVFERMEGKSGMWRSDRLRAR